MVYFIGASGTDIVQRHQYFKEDISPLELREIVESSTGISTLVLFVSSDCTRCRVFTGSLKLAARELEKQKLPMAISTINLSTYPEVTSTEDISATPTFVMYSKAMKKQFKPTSFHPEDLAQSMVDSLVPDFLTVTSRFDIEHYLSTNAMEYAVVGVFDEAQTKSDSPSKIYRDLFITTAQRLKQQFPFFIIDSSLDSTQFGLAKDTQGVVALSTFNNANTFVDEHDLSSSSLSDVNQKTFVNVFPLTIEPEAEACENKNTHRADLGDSFDANQDLASVQDDTILQHIHEASKGILSRWIIHSSFPTVGMYNSQTAKLYSMTGLPVLKLLISSKDIADEEKMHQYREFLAPIAFSHEKIHFTLASADDLASEANYYHYQDATANNVPLVLLQDVIYNLTEHYRLEPIYESDANSPFHISRATLELFLGKCLEKEMNVYFKTEQTRSLDSDETSNNGPPEDSLHYFVGSQFHDIVDQNKHQDVLLVLTKNEQFCPDCANAIEAAKNVYAQYSRAYPNHSMLLGELNTSRNDFYKSKYPTRVFPTIFLKSRDEEKPIKFFRVNPDGSWADEESSLFEMVVKYSSKTTKEDNDNVR